MGGRRGERTLFLLLGIESVVHRVQRVLEREDAEEHGERHDQGPPWPMPGGQPHERQRGGQVPGQRGRSGGGAQDRDDRGSRGRRPRGGGKHRRGGVSRRRARDGQDGQQQQERQGEATNRQHTRQGNES